MSALNFRLERAWANHKAAEITTQVTDPATKINTKKKKKKKKKKTTTRDGCKGGLGRISLLPIGARYAIRYKAIQSSRKMLAGSCLTSFVCTSLTRQTHSPLSGCKRQKTSSCIVWTAPERRLLFQQLQSFYKSSTNVRELLAPEKAQGLPSDWGFSGFIKTAAHQVLDEIPFMKAEDCIVWTAPERRLLFQQLQSFYKSSTNVRELLAPEKAQGLPSDWGFSGFIKTAAHQVLDEIPFMKAEDKDNYDKKVAFDILKWIFSPSDPARELAMRGKR
ncbi:hypothetical protein BDFG_04876 [Blastomyces dermatitidis ATCC 26199]|nr:hypothetical protein BDFG_04876 [Blastomyces dermatitidis ATCC 26199]